MTWIDEMRELSKKHSQACIAREMNYSKSTINLVLNGVYKGDLNAVERAFKRAFGTEIIDCPVLGEIKASRCLSISERPYLPSNHLRIQLYQACKDCPKNNKRKGE